MTSNMEETPKTVKVINDFRFCEETLVSTPEPQATSTANRKGNILLDESDVAGIEKEAVKEGRMNNGDEQRFLAKERDTIGSLNQRLGEMFAQIRRDSGEGANKATGEVMNRQSSLGILKLENVEDLNSTDTSKVLESLIPSKGDDCEMSWRMTRELARQSVSSRNSSVGSRFGDVSVSDEFKYKRIDIPEKDVPSLTKFDSVSEIDPICGKSVNFNPFDGAKISGLRFSALDEVFNSGETARKRLMADEADWMQERADIPVSNVDKSFSEMFSGEEGIVDLSSVSTFLMGGSGPVGNLEILNDPSRRPNFGRVILSPMKTADDERRDCIADTFPKLSKCGGLGLDHTENQHNVSVSSIASISHIKEMLGDMSIHSSPRYIIDKMMNAGSKHSKTQRTKFSDRIERNKGSVQASLVQVQKSDLQNNLENVLYERKENISDIQIIDPYRCVNKKDATSASRLIDREDCIDNRSKLSTKDAQESTNYQPMKPLSGNILKDATNLQRTALKTVDVEMDRTLPIGSESKTVDVETDRTIYEGPTEENNIKASGGSGNRNKEELSKMIGGQPIILDSSDVYTNYQKRISNVSSINSDGDCFEVGPLSRSTSLGEIDRILDTESRNSSAAGSISIQTDHSNRNAIHSVCVGVICKMDISLVNDSMESDSICTLSTVKVTRDGVPSPNAVHLMFPENVLLTPGETMSLEIKAIPLVAGLLEAVLQVKQVENGSDNLHIMNCMVKFRGEEPKVDIITEGIVGNSGTIDFGLLPEESIRKRAIRIKNSGNVRVPLVLEILLPRDVMVFYLNEPEENEVIKKVLILDPGEEVEEFVNCFTPPLTDPDNVKLERISGNLIVALVALGMEMKLLAEFKLSAASGCTRILIGTDCNPLNIPAHEKRPLVFKNAGVIPVMLKLVSDSPEFTPEKDSVSLEAEQTGIVNVSYVPVTTISGEDKCGTMWLYIESSEVRYKVNLCGHLPQSHAAGASYSAVDTEVTPKRPRSLQITASTLSSHFDSKNTTPSSSRSSSPGTSNLLTDKGSLDLACTCSALVWASCPLQVAQRKVCVLRNKKDFKEKLLLTIVDPHNCFKLVEDKGNTVQEMRLNLEAMESRQIAVSACPLRLGPSKASLIITRAGDHRRVATGGGQPQKKVLYLYGYGGKAVLNMRGVFRDPEHRMWTYLDSSSLHTKFVLENSGDGTAFVKISQDIAATGVFIIPHEALIPAHKSITVDMTFSPTAGRADHLLSEPNSDDILSVTRVTITHGDEATRLRLKRLYRKIIDEKSRADNLLMERLAILDNLFPGTSTSEVSCLKDTLLSIKTLWTEGIRENSIGVLLDRSALENAQLDATAQFIDLATTVTDDTVYCPRQQLVVAPRVVNLSWTQTSASFALRNTSVLATRVRIECVSGLLVEPQSVTIQPHSSCTVTVNHTGDCDLVSSSVLKIHSDSSDVIEVPVNWNRSSVQTPYGKAVKGEADGKGAVFSKDYNIVFPTAVVGGKTVCRICLCNTTKETVTILVEDVDGPFDVRSREFPLKGEWYLSLRVYFKPKTTGAHSGTLTISVNRDKILKYNLTAQAMS